MTSSSRTAPAHTLLLALALALLIPASRAAAADVFTTQAAPRTVTLTGFTRARAEMDLVAEEPGRVVSVAADVGDAIGQNGLFSCQDPTFLRLDLADNEVEQRRLESRVAWLDLEAGRYRTLVAEHTAQQSVLDELEQNLDQARYQLKALKVAADVLRERLDRLCVKAPAGWRVSERLVEPGQWVAAGTVVGRAGDYGTLVAPFALSPEEYQALRKTEKLTLTLTDLNQELRARIHTVSPSFDESTRKIEVELALDKGLAERRGGLRARLELATDDESGAVLAPPSALIERYEQHWLTRPDGSQAAVVVLGPGPSGTQRVAGPEVSAGQPFLLRPLGPAGASAPTAGE